MPNTAYPHIDTPRLTLRLATSADVPTIIAYYSENNQHLAPWEPHRGPEFFTRQLWEREVWQHSRQFEMDIALWLFMFSKDSPKTVIGGVNFTGIIRGVADYCYLGYSLAEKVQGQGLMTEGVKAAIEYVFDELNIHRIMADYMPRNERSGNLLKRLGFTVEGFARDYLRINGNWEDHILTSLTNHAWVAKDTIHSSIVMPDVAPQQLAA